MGYAEHSNVPHSGTTSVGANYIHIVPNSHFWTNLTQLTDSIEFGWLNKEIGKEFILIGLENTIKNGYNIKPIQGKFQMVMSPCFDSVEQMIEYVRNESYSESAFYVLLNQTINNGLNLTNGLKMERREIYKCLDGERDYQDANWGSRRQMDGTPDEEKPVAEWINYIEYHVSKAKEKVYHLDTVGATAELRKVAALAVRAMEIHGCPARDNGKIWNPLMGTSPEEQAKE